MPGPFSGLSVKIIATIIVVILAVEVVIYLPSAANFRQNWLTDRLRVGIVAARVLDAVPDAMNLPRMITDRLLNSAGALAIVYRREGQSQLIELENTPMPREAVTIDMRVRDPATLIMGALDTLMLGGDRMLRIVGEEEGQEQSTVEVLMPEAPLRADLLVYSRNLLVLALILAAFTSAVLYVFVSLILIAPIRRLTGNMMNYREAPENAALIVAPTLRRDEIGVMERELASMESDIFSMLRQRRHLADLGLAVAKINHDLRNTLTSAQLLSDQVATLDDPKVQRLAPRLVQSIDKAIGFAQSVLDYGRQSVTPPRAGTGRSAGDARRRGLRRRPRRPPGDRLCATSVPEGVTISADPDQLSRVFINLIKNAREALEAASARITAPAVEIGYATAADGVTITVADNGPGLPPRARDNLFVAFEGSARAGGTGLGLAIARELTEAHGGRLVLWTSRWAPGSMSHFRPRCSSASPVTRLSISLLGCACNAPLPHVWVCAFRRTCRPACAPVAQLDRASDYESEGRTFESFRARQFFQALGSGLLPIAFRAGRQSAQCALCVPRQPDAFARQPRQSGQGLTSRTRAGARWYGGFESRRADWRYLR